MKNFHDKFSRLDITPDRDTVRWRAYLIYLL